jgi:hypothetical protein
MSRFNVRFGSLADILRCGSHVHFTPNSGHLRLSFECLLCADAQSFDLVVEGRARSIVRAFIRKDIAPIQWFRLGENQIFGRK